MIKDSLTYLYYKKYLSRTDCYFARFLDRFSEPDSAVQLAAALTSRATGDGDVCLDLSRYSGRRLIDDPARPETNRFCPELSDWSERLIRHPAVGRPGERRPLILDDRNRLYLFRYWEYERKLSEAISERADRENEVDPIRFRESIRRLFPEAAPEVWTGQILAAAAALLKRFCVISGGPGTGKTTVVAKILAALLEQDENRDLRIMLAAPTGKAAARLKETMGNAKSRLDCEAKILGRIPEAAGTLHRLLRTVPGSPYFRHHGENPLPADVLVVDEASMVDLGLMSKLVEAVPERARLILIGDRDQLASVEAGSVLGDICDRRMVDRFSTRFRQGAENLSGRRFTPDDPKPMDPPGLQDCIVMFTESFRFGTASGIGDFSRAVNSGDGERVIEVFGRPRSDEPVIWESPGEIGRTYRKLESWIIAGYGEVLRTADPNKALEMFNRFRILCAVRKGPYGVEALNGLAETVLAGEGLIRRTDPPWYRGRPILVTRNDYRSGLFNGDFGVTMADFEGGEDPLAVYFQGSDGQLIKFGTRRLPAHETAFAMTVHKSQGSEFDEVLLVLPERDAPVLSRELVYTGITRARKRATILAGRDILTGAVARNIRRTSGLRDALWR